MNAHHECEAPVDYLTTPWFLLVPVLTAGTAAPPRPPAGSGPQDAWMKQPLDLALCFMKPQNFCQFCSLMSLSFLLQLENHC
jgi:hypothetical protein